MAKIIYPETLHQYAQAFPLVACEHDASGLVRVFCQPQTDAARALFGLATHKVSSHCGAFYALCPVETINKASLWKTARALISCAKFKAGEFVAVRYFSTDVNGVKWFECANEKFPDPVPPCWYKSACYPEHHLTEFCL